MLGRRSGLGHMNKNNLFLQICVTDIICTCGNMKPDMYYMEAVNSITKVECECFVCNSFKHGYDSSEVKT